MCTCLGKKKRPYEPQTRPRLTVSPLDPSTLSAPSVQGGESLQLTRRPPTACPPLDEAAGLLPTRPSGHKAPVGGELARDPGCLCVRIGRGLCCPRPGSRGQRQPLGAWTGPPSAPCSAGVWTAERGQPARPALPGLASPSTVVPAVRTVPGGAAPPQTRVSVTRHMPRARDALLPCRPWHALGPAVSGLKWSVRQGEGGQGVPGAAEGHPATGAGEPGRGRGGRKEGYVQWGFYSSCPTASGAADATLIP